VTRIESSRLPTNNRTTRGLIAELKRRRVPQTAGLYILVSWIAIQVSATIFPLLDLPVMASKAVLATLAIGFLPALLLSWFYDLRLPGISRTRGAAAGPTDTTGQASIVVLPFANMSADPNNEYFSDGVGEDITNALTRIEGLRVVSRTSAYSFRGKNLSARDIGGQLNVAFVLEGSVRRIDNRIRMAVKLARTNDDSVLWAEQYDRVLTDVFAVQDEVTHHIVATISNALNLAPPQSLEKIRAANLEAYDLYLLGRHQWNKRSEAGMRKALDLFEQAVELDPDYAPAWSGISDASALLGTWNFALPTEMFPRAVAAAERALALDDGLAEAHASIGFIKYNWEWDWAGAERELRRAIELNPSLENAYRWLSGLLAGSGRDREALPIAEQVVALDPLSVLPHMNLGIVHWLAERYDSAVNEFTRVVEMDPRFARGHLFRAAALSFAGRHQEAMQAIDIALELSNRHAMMRFVRATCFQAAGRMDEARAQFQQVLPELHGLYAATAHMYLGNFEPMYVALDKAIAERGDWMYSLVTQPYLKQLRSQPRFQELLRTINVTGDRTLAGPPAVRSPI
jgi:TolB-like protein/tetratricopeptide (TPR) repeat protein